MGFFDQNKKKSEEQEFVSGGGITANYDNAIKYAVLQLRKYSAKAFENIDHPVEVLLNHRLYIAKSNALLDTLVFVYGKTPKQVEADVLKALKEKMEG